jgi:hypothetical protein
MDAFFGCNGVIGELTCVAGVFDGVRVVVHCFGVAPDDVTDPRLVLLQNEQDLCILRIETFRKDENHNIIYACIEMHQINDNIEMTMKIDENYKQPRELTEFFPKYLQEKHKRFIIRNNEYEDDDSTSFDCCNLPPSVADELVVSTRHYVEPDISSWTVTEWQEYNRRYHSLSSIGYEYKTGVKDATKLSTQEHCIIDLTINEPTIKRIFNRYLQPNICLILIYLQSAPLCRTLVEELLTVDI